MMCEIDVIFYVFNIKKTIYVIEQFVHNGVNQSQIENVQPTINLSRRDAWPRKKMCFLINQSS